DRAIGWVIGRFVIWRSIERSAHYLSPNRLLNRQPPNQQCSEAFMKAVCWHGARDVRVDQVPDPEILNPRDAIVRVTATAICGSDPHLYNGYIPAMESGDVLGHEFM